MTKPRRNRGRPRSDERDIARAMGIRTYDGQPCRKGHGGERYTSTAACVACVAGYRRADELEQLFS